MSNSIKAHPTISSCGIDCGLCPRYYTKGTSLAAARRFAGHRADVAPKGQAKAQMRHGGFGRLCGFAKGLE